MPQAQEARPLNRCSRRISSRVGPRRARFYTACLKSWIYQPGSSEEWVLKMLQSGGYDAQWQPVLTDWLRAVLHAPLTTQGFPSAS